MYVDEPQDGHSQEVGLAYYFLYMVNMVIRVIKKGLSQGLLGFISDLCQEGPTRAEGRVYTQP